MPRIYVHLYCVKRKHFGENPQYIWPIHRYLSKHYITWVLSLRLVLITDDQQSRLGITRWLSTNLFTRLRRTTNQYFERILEVCCKYNRSARINEILFSFFRLYYNFRHSRHDLAVYRFQIFISKLINIKLQFHYMIVN